MNNSPIIFRLNDSEIELLKGEQLEGESINQTASRLLKEKLGIQNVNIEYTILEKMIDDRVNAKIKSLLDRIETLENKPKRSRSKKQADAC